MLDHSKPIRVFNIQPQQKKWSCAGDLATTTAIKAYSIMTAVIILRSRTSLRFEKHYSVLFCDVVEDCSEILRGRLLQYELTRV